MKALFKFSSIQFSHLVMSDSLNPMYCSMPGLPVHHQFPSLLKLMSIELVMPSNHLILCRPLLLLPSVFPGIRVFSKESVLHIRWPKYWSFSFSICPSNEYSGLIVHATFLNWIYWLFSSNDLQFLSMLSKLFFDNCPNLVIHLKWSFLWN